jgi:hypothetical protein
MPRRLGVIFRRPFVNFSRNLGGLATRVASQIHRKFHASTPAIFERIATERGGVLGSKTVSDTARRCPYLDPLARPLRMKSARFLRRL